MIRLVLALAFSSMAWGQMSGPILGYVPEGPRIRTMQGIPAAGAVGPLLDTGRNLGQIAISPRQDYILATAADTGEVLLVVPGQAAVPLAGATANPGKILLSPNGSSAALWFYETSRAQIISGLPNAPSTREVDAGFLHTEPTVAISDDGNYLAVGTLGGAGVYVFARDGSMSTIPVDFVQGLAFFHNQSTLAIATSDLVFTADAASTASPALIHNFGYSSNGAQVAVTADNRRIVALQGTIITNIDLAGNSSSMVDLGWLPEGLFWLGGSFFRLTSAGPQIGVTEISSLRVTERTLNFQPDGVRLFDAADGRILAVPRALSSGASLVKPGHIRIVPAGTLPALPAVTIGGLPVSSGPAQQPAMTISIANTFPVDVTGTATLTFASSVGGDDQTIQFGTSGRTVNFTIPTGSLQANFNGKANVAMLTGTVAGTITVKLSLSASGTDVTPTPQPSAAIAVTANVPFIQAVQLQQGTGGFTVFVTGFSTTRDMVSGLFHFAPSSNATLASPDVTVQLGAAFTSWYSNSASNALGSEFLLTVPFTTQNGPAPDIVAVTVTLTNSKGTSNSAVNQ